ncbi:cohesin domain-containing protein [Salinibacter ruber]|uniref:cohesin domain-containing protein n=1 Tax=Salinibacter ruber TaxID=146919 RepID=UPI002168898D|nr:cohesin domain-containing protein [Salinibacter ruber]MCS3785441.1 hypothetical protein [Salinibacter ruber]
MSLSATQHSALKTIASVLSGIFLGVALMWAGPAAAQDETTVSIESQSAESGEAVDVPVDVTNFDGVGAITLVINYDPNVLSFPDGTDGLITGAPRDFSANVSEPGELRISFFDGTGNNPINFGDGTLLTLTPNEFLGGTTELTFGADSEITAENTDPIGATFEGGVVSGELSTLTAGSSTEVGLNQTVSVPLSADSIQNVGSASIELAFNENALQFDGLAADSSGLDLQADASGGVVSIGGFDTGGTTLAEDFVEVQFTFLGGASNLSFLSATEISDVSGNQIQTGFDDGTVSGDEPTLAFADASVQPGDTASVALQANEVQELGSASVDVTFNAASFTFVDTEEAIEGFNLSASSPETGVVRLGGFNASGVDPADNDGNLVNLRFVVEEGFSPGSQATLGFNPAQSELSSPNGTLYNTRFDSGTITSIDRQVSLATQALDLTADDTELQVTNVTAEAGDAILITTDDGDGEFAGDEDVVGARTVDSELNGEALTVDVLGSTDTEDASPGDHAAHISTDGGFTGVVSTSQTAAIYGVAQFDWQDETVDGETSTVTVDAIEILYGGNVGPDTVSINLHEAPDGEITGSFVGVSQEDLPVGEVHENVAVDVIEPVSPSDENPQRTEDEISETGEFFAMAHLGPAGTGANGGRIPVGGSQQPPLTTTGTPPVIGDFANVNIGFAANVSRSFDNTSDPANYELVALPGAADVDVAETVSGDVGTNWRAFLEVGASDGDGEAGLQDYADEAFSFEAGNGVWVLAQEGWSFEGTIPSVNASDGTPSIGLQGGWNVISNPLREDLSWDGVQSANGLSDVGLFRWAGEDGFEDVNTLESAANNGEAYYVLNEAGLDSLDLTAGSGSSSTLAESSESTEKSGPRVVDVSATSEASEVTSTVAVGLDRSAEESTSFRAPPAHFGGTALRVQSGDPAKSYKRMISATDAGMTTFDLSLQASPGASVEVSASDLPEESDFGVVLIKQDGETTHDLRAGPATVTVDQENGLAELKVQVGSAEEIAQETTPDKTRLRANYPNPFSQQTTVEYALAEQSEVSVRVYNVLGQQVATLVQGTQQAGTHQVEWDGNQLSSGKYFVRMEAGGKTDTKQITVVR